MAVDEFKEKETGFITHVFLDQNENPVVPDDAVYTLYDEKTDAIINSRTEIAIPGLAATVDLELVPADNQIINQTLDVEVHVLFVEWTYNTDKKGKEELRFNVKNLNKVT